jgi:hypothetical protein
LAAEAAGTLVVLGVALWYWLLYFHRGTNLLDEGSQAAQALRVLNGEVIYRDFFTVVTPFSYYTVAWLFDLFGAELMVMRWTVLALGMGIAALTLLVARRVMAWPFAAAAALMTTVWGWFTVAPNFYSWEASCLVLVALGCYMRHAQTGGRWWIAAAGIAAGLSAMTKQNVGAYVTAALLLCIWLSAAFDTAFNLKRRLRLTAWLAGGVAVPVLSTLVMLVAAGAGPYLYESWVYYPLVKYPPRFSVPYPAFYPLLPDLQLATIGDVAGAWERLPEAARYELITRIVIYIPAVVYPFTAAAVAVLAGWYRRSGDADLARHGHLVLAVALVGFLTLFQAWPRADVTHILFGLQPTFILFAYLWWCAWKALARVPGPQPPLQAVALVLTLAPLLALVWYGYARTDWEYQNYVAALQVDRGRGVLAHPSEAERINKMTGFIQHNTVPDDPIFVVPWASGFYFLTGRDNPTRSDFILFEDPEAYPCILSRLEQNPPKYVIYGYTWDVDGRHFSDYARPIDAYIRTRYVLEDSVDGYEAWRRIDSAGARSGDWERACQPRRFRLRDLFERPVQ